ncbi:MAG: phosphoribosylaminoimidazolesuccinocarboxamide synthase [Bacteroidetes bacterium SW_9_63_38]|nr:MAG: phosphoribosylaminoimidazolesuccinocarboxamide synthase [Bacteroidetes bacterium SW_9_63_38]
MDQQQIAAHLDHPLDETHFDDLGERYQGKVRDTYRQGDHLILITTDRISAFDHVLAQTIPFKGQVLNQTAAYFFEATKDLVPNHVIDVPDPNVTVAESCTPVPIEFVVRGYLEGHAWREYDVGARALCGASLPDGLQQGEALPEPIVTPTTKAETGHDQDVTPNEAIAGTDVTAAEFEQLREWSLALFNRGSDMAEEQGLLLVDTKYEFGRTPDGDFVLIDEVHTPDSSRYYYQDGYDERLAAGKSQEQLSKEFVREWLMDHDFQGREDEVMPNLPDDFRVTVTERYIELYERVTGLDFEPALGDDPDARIHSALAPYRQGAES